MATTGNAQPPAADRAWDRFLEGLDIYARDCASSGMGRTEAEADLKKQYSQDWVPLHGGHDGASTAIADILSQYY